MRNDNLFKQDPQPKIQRLLGDMYQPWGGLFKKVEQPKRETTRIERLTKLQEKKDE